jgi:hypothetical protein
MATVVMAAATVNVVKVAAAATVAKTAAAGCQLRRTFLEIRITARTSPQSSCKIITDPDPAGPIT